MPGRGPYWKEGGLPNFSVQLEDLTQSLQDQITGGGGGSGNWEKVGELLVSGGAIAKADINFTRTVSLDGTDVSQVVVIIHEENTPAGGNKYRFNNLIGLDFKTKGAHLGSATYDSFSISGQNGIFADVSNSSRTYTVIKADGKQGSDQKTRGTIETVDDGAGVESGTGYWVTQTNVSALTSFQMEDQIGGGNTIDNGTHIVIYAVTLN